MYNAIKRLVDKAFSLVHSYKNGDDSSTRREKELPYDDAVLKTELLNMFEEETK